MIKILTIYLTKENIKNARAAVVLQAKAAGAAFGRKGAGDCWLQPPTEGTAGPSIQGSQAGDEDEGAQSSDPGTDGGR